MNKVLREVLSELDAALSVLETGIERLRAAVPADAAAMEKSLRKASSLAEDIRTQVAEAARQAGFRGAESEWRTRHELDELLGRVEGSALARELESRRRLIASLIEALSRGTVQHRIAAKAWQLTALKETLVRDLSDIVLRPEPPDLGVPPGATDWLQWVWTLNEPDISVLLEKVRSCCETLAEFVCEVDPGWWVPEANLEVRPPEPMPPGGEGGRPVLDGQLALEGEEGREAIPDSEPEASAGHAVPTPMAEEPATPSVDAQTEAPSTGRAIVATSEPSPGPVQDAREPPAREAGDGLEQPATSVAGRPAAEASTAAPDDPAPSSNGPETSADVARASSPAAPGLLTEAPAAEPAPRVAERPAHPASGPDSGNAPAAADRSPPEAPAPLPADLGSYDSFGAAYWIDPAGHCVHVPWADAAFRDALCRAMEAELKEQRLRYIWIYAKACSDLESPTLVDHEDVKAISDLLCNPASPSSGRDPQRFRNLRAAISAGVSAKPAWRLKSLLEALRPSHDGSPLTYHEVDQLMEGLCFRSDDVAEIIRHCLQIGGGASGPDPIDRLRDAFRVSPPASPAELRARLQKQREALRELVRKRWNAAGGQARQTHCREAWSEYIDAVSGTFKKLYPEGAGGLKSWNAKSLSAEVAGLLTHYEKVMNSNHVWLTDRRRMDRVANELYDAAAAVNDTRRQLQESESPVAAPVEPALLDRMNRLESGRVLPEADEELCRRVLIRVVRQTPVGAEDQRRHALTLVVGDLCEHPALLSVVQASALDMDRADNKIADADQVTDAKRAAAILLARRRPAHGEERISPFEIVARALQESGREYLLTLCRGLSAQDRTRVHRERGDVVQQIHLRLGQLEQLCRDLGDLGVAKAKDFEDALAQARHTCAQEDERSRDPRLKLSWLERLVAAAQEWRNWAHDGIRRRAAALPPDKRDQVLQMLGRSRFGEAILVMGSVRISSGRVETDGGLARGIRETEFRADARPRFRDPAEYLRRATGGADPMHALTDRWTRPHSERRDDQRRLRQAFATFALASIEAVTGAESESLRVPCEKIRTWLAQQKLNPTYLPQLERFHELVVLTSTDPRKREFLQETARVIAREERNICLVLAPGITEEVRERALAEIRRRDLAAAVIDDLDVCRLIDARGQRPNTVIGLMEVFLEQQTWTRYSPFEGRDGKHVAIEMFVGRKEEVDQLTETHEYSRVFSGRKLGKSALAAYTQVTRDGKPLGAGRQLRILYLDIAGIEHELTLVEAVAGALRTKLSVEIRQPRSGEEPGEYLSDVVEGVLASRPDINLLVFLDEADVFFAAQRRMYDAKGERCLSFKLRALEGKKDAAGKSRVRFVFSGYRRTRESYGAWANWGRVLRLGSLNPEEAEQFIAGALARLGIDAAEQAPVIAYRCGYQPAILLRFGQQLLAHLKETRGSRDRDRLVVSANDVAATASHQSVVEEIQTLVGSNFAGSNRATGIVFNALLLEFTQWPPGHAIDEADRRILERLREIGGDMGWLRSEESSALRLIQHAFDDLVDRQLLIRHRGAVRFEDHAYSLKFPHHLPVLIRQGLEEQIREENDALSKEHDLGDPYQDVVALVSRRELDDIRMVASSDSTEIPARLAIAVSHWPDSVAHPIGGIPSRTGISASLVVPAARGLTPEEWDAPQLAVTGAAPVDVDAILARRRRELAAVLATGGADLLRWGLGLLGKGDEIVVLAGVGRLTRKVIGWWFERVRCLEFTRSDAIDRIRGLTSGIPLLVGRFDAALREGGVTDSANVGNDQLERAIDRLKSSFPEIARELAAGDPGVRLEPRELEVLRMAAWASREADGDPEFLRMILTDEWPQVAESSSDLRGLPPLDDGDSSPLSVVEFLGLLPVDPEQPGTIKGALDRLLPLEAGDALYQLLQSGTHP